jgi:hypothetical protein
MRLISANIPKFLFANGGVLPELAALGPKAKMVPEAQGSEVAVLRRDLGVT